MKDIIKSHGVTQNHNTENRHPVDYYSTDPHAVEYLLRYETFSKHILEPMVGGGAIAEVLKKHGHKVTAMDLYDRGYPDTIIQNFLEYQQKFMGDIISNPPYTKVHEYILKALEIATGKVAMLLKIQFLESITRYNKIFKQHPPTTIYIFVKRISCYKNGEYNPKDNAMCFCWIIWDKNNPTTTTTFKWIPNHIKEET